MIKKRVVIVFLISTIANSCFMTSEPKGGGFSYTYSKSSNMAKELGTFINHYDMLAPFEYEDSIFSIKLVFNDVFSETTYLSRHEIVAEYDSCGIPFFVQQIVGKIDTTRSEVFFLQDSNYNKERIYKKFEAHGANFKYFRVKCEQNIGGGGIFQGGLLVCKEPILEMPSPHYIGCIGLQDTVKIIVEATYLYKELCGIDDSKEILFGKMVFVKRKDSVQNEILEKKVNKKRKKLPIIY